MENVIRVEDGKYVGSVVNVGKGSVSVTADGVKTFNQLFAELFALVDISKVTKDTRLTTSQGALYTLKGRSNSHLEFMWCGCNSSSLSIQDLRLEATATNNHLTVSNANSNNTFSTQEYGSTAATSGLTYSIEY